MRILFLLLLISSYFFTVAVGFAAFPATKISTSAQNAFLKINSGMSMIAPENENFSTDNSDFKVAPSSNSIDSRPEGYLPSDFSSIGDGKQTRVLLYIALALVPCIALIPFFLSRDFVPPIDPEYSINSKPFN